MQISVGLNPSLLHGATKSTSGAAGKVDAKRLLGSLGSTGGGPKKAKKI